MDDAHVFHLIQPDEIADPLTDVLRDGAAKLLACAIEAEVEAHLAAYSKLKLPNGQQRIVRHGHMPEREVQTGVGAIKIKAPRVRDRSREKKIRFQSGILSKYVRRTKSLEALIPWLQGSSFAGYDFAAHQKLGERALCCQPVKAAPHISETGRQPHFRSCRQRDHDDATAAISRSNWGRSSSSDIKSRRPFGNMISARSLPD